MEFKGNVLLIVAALLFQDKSEATGNLPLLPARRNFGRD
jgi:hypothetical protein